MTNKFIIIDEKTNQILEQNISESLNIEDIESDSCYVQIIINSSNSKKQLINKYTINGFSFIESNPTITLDGNNEIITNLNEEQETK